MTMKKTIVLLVVVGALGVMLGTPWRTAAQDWNMDRPCNIGGSWLGNFPAGGPYDIPLLVSETLTPVDPAGDRMAYVMRLLNTDFTFSGMFPETNVVSDLVGEAVRTDPNAYEVTVIGYGTKKPVLDGVAWAGRGQIQYIWVLSGLALCVDDNTVEHELQMSLYSGIDNPDFAFPWNPDEAFPLHNQDLDGDGLPDEGETPIFSGPFSHVSKRVSHSMMP